MRARAAALALLLACSGVAGAMGGTGEIGEGAGRLTPAALRVARAKWGDELCLAAIEVDANAEYNCRMSGERPGAVNEFTFRVFNPHRPYDLCYGALPRGGHDRARVHHQPGPAAARRVGDLRGGRRVLRLRLPERHESGERRGHRRRRAGRSRVGPAL